MGRELHLPGNIQRIACIGGALRYLVYMEGLDKLVGVEALEQKKKWCPAMLWSRNLGSSCWMKPSII